MKLNCWIVDDEPLALELLSSYVSRTPFLNLTGKYSSAVKAMEDLSKDEVNVIFLDIQMPEVNGMEFAQMIDENTRIIFTTAFSEYALDGYRVNALDYLLKPFSYSDFLNAAKRALKWYEMKMSAQENKENISDGIFVRADYKLIHILYDDILMIEGLKDYIKIYSTKEKRPIITLMSLKAMEEDLPAGRFIRVHRSYIISRSKISSIDKNRIIINEHQVPIGETYRKAFMDAINS